MNIDELFARATAFKQATDMQVRATEHASQLYAEAKTQTPEERLAALEESGRINYAERIMLAVALEALTQHAHNTKRQFADLKSRVERLEKAVDAFKAGS